MHFIVKGHCSIWINDFETEEEKNLKVLDVGEYFGEITLITRMRRTASVYAVKPSKTLTLNRENFKAFQNKFGDSSSISESLINRYKRYFRESDTNMSFILESVKNIPWLRNLRPGILQEIIR